MNEARREMKDENLLKYVEECVDTLANAGFDATMDDINCVVSDATRTFGTMSIKKSSNDKYTLTLSSFLNGETEEAIKNVIYHELCHYLQFKYLFNNEIYKIVGNKILWGRNATERNKIASKSHGDIWKMFANKVGKLTGQNITRTNTYDLHNNVGKAHEEKVKYIVKCKNCGQEYKYTKKTDFVKNPNAKSLYGDWYKWNCGTCKSKGQFEVIERNSDNG